MGGEARAGQVVNTNTPFLSMVIEDLIGVAPETPGPVVDDREALRDRLAQVLGVADRVSAPG